MRHRIYYYPGFKFGYVLAGLAILVISICLFFVPVIAFLGFPLLIAGAIFILSIHGIAIDFKKRQLDRYTDLILYKTHEYTDLNGYDTVSIVFEKSTPKRGILNYMPGIGSRSYNGMGDRDTPVVSFEMYLYGFTREKLFLSEYGSHAEARVVANQLKAKLNFKIEDTVQQGIEFYKKNPSKRRR
jgi:hypothetical protein